MSGPAQDPKVRRRRIAVRAACVIVYIILVAIVFVFGKGHSLLIDNKDAPDGSYSAIDGVLVSVDGKEALELYEGDRDIVLLKGQSHIVAIEPVFGGEKTEKSFSLPIDADMLLLSVPKLLAGIEPYIERFSARDASPPPADESSGTSNLFTSPDAEAPPEAPAP